MIGMDNERWKIWFILSNVQVTCQYRVEIFAVRGFNYEMYMYVKQLIALEIMLTKMLKSCDLDNICVSPLKYWFTWEYQVLESTMTIKGKGPSIY